MNRRCRRPRAVTRLEGLTLLDTQREVAAASHAAFSSARRRAWASGGWLVRLAARVEIRLGGTLLLCWPGHDLDAILDTADLLGRPPGVYDALYNEGAGAYVLVAVRPLPRGR